MQKTTKSFFFSYLTVQPVYERIAAHNRSPLAEVSPWTWWRNTPGKFSPGEPWGQNMSKHRFLSEGLQKKDN